MNAGNGNLSSLSVLNTGSEAFNWPQLFAVGLLAFLLQSLLVVNPGYFSHDDLQWGAFASGKHWMELPWTAWLNWQQFQYRPLTFKTWLVLSRFLFDTPHMYHAVFLFLGSINTVLLYRLLSVLRCAPLTAAVGSLGFALSPYGTFVHGWIATLADLLWVGMTICLAIAMVHAEKQHWRARWIIAIAAGLTIPALLAKEAAIVIPVLAALAWFVTRRSRAAGWTVVGSGVPVFLYLYLRLPVLLSHPSESSAYEVVFSGIPSHLAEYFLYLPYPPVFEVHNILSQPVVGLILVALLWLVIIWTYWRKYPVSAWLLVLGVTLAMAPVLVVPSAANQYGYVFATIVALALSLGWARVSLAGRACVIVLLFLSLWHGLNVQLQMLRIGRLQAVFQPALADVLREREGQVRLLPPDEYRWVFARFTHQIPSYAGVAIADRVQLVHAEADADYLISAAGYLLPAD